LSLPWRAADIEFSVGAGLLVPIFCLTGGPLDESIYLKAGLLIV